MREYEFSIKIKEDDSPFWEDLEGTGAPALHNIVRDIFEDNGFNDRNCIINLTHYKSNEVD